MSPKIISAAIQLVPLLGREQGFPLIDAAIDCIVQSGLTYRVTAFETQIEGTFEEIQQLITEIHRVHQRSDVPEVLMYVKYHIHQSEDQHLQHKTQRFESEA